MDGANVLPLVLLTVWKTVGVLVIVLDGMDSGDWLTDRVGMSVSMTVTGDGASVGVIDCVVRLGLEVDEESVETDGGKVEFGCVEDVGVEVEVCGADVDSNIDGDKVELSDGSEDGAGVIGIRVGLGRNPGPGRLFVGAFVMAILGSIVMVGLVVDGDTVGVLVGSREVVLVGINVGETDGSDDGT